MMKKNLGQEFWSNEPLDEPLNDKYTLRDLTITNTGLPNMPTDAEKANLRWLANTLVELEKDLGAFNILSAFRTAAVHNKITGQSTFPPVRKKSFHEAGMAVDLYPTTKSIGEFYGHIFTTGWNEKLGEIAIKPTQNAIHLSLPTDKLRNKPLIMDEAGKYISMTMDEITRDYINPFVEMVSQASEYVEEKTKIPLWGWLLGAFGSLFLVFGLKGRK